MAEQERLNRLHDWMVSQKFHEVMPLPDEAAIRTLDFTVNNESLANLDLQDAKGFHAFVFDGMIYGTGGKAGVGGYLEPRVLYQRSNHFGGEEPRSLHLGVDIWMEDYTPVFAPSDGIIHSLADNAGFGNYGPTIILEHESPAGKWYSLYGHLSLDSLKAEPQQIVRKGEKIAELGPYDENGNWPPHLHFQLMTDMMGNSGDFPGVAAPSEKTKFAAICPDPNLVLGIEKLR